ncbi:MAG: CRISPR-associated protein Cas4 [Longimicrobiales bacterium]
MTHPSAIAIGGMLVGYHALCHRKAWLSMRGLWMEQESDAVAIGRLIDEMSYARERSAVDIQATSPDGTRLVGRIDWADLRDGVLHETKKSRAVEDAHRWQLRFYLWLLKLSGVARRDGRAYTGMLNYPALRRTEPVYLSADDEESLVRAVAELRRLSGQPKPPPRLAQRAFCRRCAFEEMCYG